MEPLTLINRVTYIWRRMLRRELPGKRKRGKAKKEVYGCGERGHG